MSTPLEQLAACARQGQAQLDFWLGFGPNLGATAEAVLAAVAVRFDAVAAASPGASALASTVASLAGRPGLNLLCPRRRAQAVLLVAIAPPTPAEVAAALQALCLRRSQVAALVPLLDDGGETAAWCAEHAVPYHPLLAAA